MTSSFCAQLLKNGQEKATENGQEIRLVYPIVNVILLPTLTSNMLHIIIRMNFTCIRTVHIR